MTIEIGNKLKQLNAMLSELDNIYQSLLKVHGVSESEYAVMFTIKELGEGCNQKDIADSSYISKKTINSTVKKLEKDGILKLKAAKYPNMEIFLTDKGRCFIEKNIIPIIQVENKVLENMSDNEFEFLTTYYRIYIKGFKTHVDNYIKNKKSMEKKEIVKCR